MLFSHLGQIDFPAGQVTSHADQGCSSNVFFFCPEDYKDVHAVRWLIIRNLFLLFGFPSPLLVRGFKASQQLPEFHRLFDYMLLVTLVIAISF